jgi:hypothetical protein
VLLAAGCGGEPSLPSSLAARLAPLADSTAERLDAGDHCAARDDAAELHDRAIVAINDGRVPAELQEELLAAANALLEAISCTPPRADAGAEEEARELAGWLRERSD